MIIGIMVIEFCFFNLNEKKKNCNNIIVFFLISHTTCNIFLLILDNSSFFAYSSLGDPQMWNDAHSESENSNFQMWVDAKWPG